MSNLHWIRASDPPDAFPSVEIALREPDGLLAAGGDLSPARLLAAYRHGIFPWYEAGQPILWWSPDPRTVLFPEALHVSRSLRRCVRRGRFDVSFDRDFDAVVRACAQPRLPHGGTWITAEMSAAYAQLHDMGHAHSVEVWQDDRLVGGLYGVALGKVFFGESMYSRASNASKIALFHLVARLLEHGFGLIDCQMSTPHLKSLGARDIPRTDYLRTLDRLCDTGPPSGLWRET